VAYSSCQPTIPAKTFFLRFFENLFNRDLLRYPPAQKKIEAPARQQLSLLLLLEKKSAQVGNFVLGLRQEME
jgi:hypothetical protein